MGINKKLAVAQTVTKVQAMQSAMPLGQMASGERVPIQSRRQDQPLFDTEEFAQTGAQRVRFFADAAGKSVVDTNMVTEGAMPGQSTFAFYAIRVAVLNYADGTSPTLSDMQNIRRTCWLQYLKGSKPIWRMPLEKLPAPGFHGLQASVNAASVNVLNLGNPVPGDYHPLGFIISIPAGRLYGIEIVTAPEFAMAGQEVNLRMRVWLEGVLSNPVR